MILGMSVWRNDIKCKYMFMFPLNNLARKELSEDAIFGMFCLESSTCYSPWTKICLKSSLNWYLSEPF